MIDLLNWGLRTGVVITGLIGLVLLLRRPFAHYFGAEATFLLWSLPLIRLCMPDIYLPKKESGIFLPYDTFPVCLLYTSPSPRDQRGSRMPSSA